MTGSFISITFSLITVAADADRSCRPVLRAGSKPVFHAAKIIVHPMVKTTMAKSLTKPSNSGRYEASVLMRSRMCALGIYATALRRKPGGVGFDCKEEKASQYPSSTR
jgi:hypothetical protein